MDLDPKAYILFAESEGMFHNTRVEIFQGFIASKPGFDAYCLPEKLLVDEEKLTGDVVSVNSVLQNESNLPKHFDLAKVKTYHAMDANEYFDWCVTSKYMYTFFQLTPPSVTASQYCDIRFNAQLERLAREKNFPVAGINQWLYIHYKQSMKTKKKNV